MSKVKKFLKSLAKNSKIFEKNDNFANGMAKIETKIWISHMHINMEPYFFTLIMRMQTEHPNGHFFLLSSL